MRLIHWFSFMFLSLISLFTQAILFLSHNYDVPSLFFHCTISLFLLKYSISFHYVKFLIHHGTFLSLHVNFHYAFLRLSKHVSVCLFFSVIFILDLYLRLNKQLKTDNEEKVIWNTDVVTFILTSSLNYRLNF